MKPLEVWTCQRAENLKKSSKIPKNNYAATMVSAARRQIIGGGGGGAPINKSRRRPQIVGGGARGRRTALLGNTRWLERIMIAYPMRFFYQTRSFNFWPMRILGNIYSYVVLSFPVCYDALLIALLHNN